MFLKDKLVLIRTGYSLSTAVSPVSIILPMLYAYLSGMDGA